MSNLPVWVVKHVSELEAKIKKLEDENEKYRKALENFLNNK